MNKQNLTVWTVVGGAVLVLCVGLYFNGKGSTVPANTAPTLGTPLPSGDSSTTADTINPATTVAATTDTSPQYSQHNSDYVYSYLSALSELYQGTQTEAEAQAQLGSGQDDQNTTILLTLSETLNHLKNAQTYMSSYTNDSNPAIKATATLLYADLTIQVNAATQAENAYSSAIDNQDVADAQSAQTAIVAYASDQNQTQNDIAKALVGIKYVIQNTSDNPNPTGDISYQISPDNRTYLIGQIAALFPTPLDTSNVYELYAKAIQLSMASDTYEQEASAKL